MTTSNLAEVILPLSPSQQGMLFDSLGGAQAGSHLEQWVCSLQGPLDAELFRGVWQRILDRHSVLRTGFVWREQSEPLQIVVKRLSLPFERLDWTSLPAAERQARLAAYLDADRQRGFQLSKPPLMRMALIRLDPDQHWFVWTHHHIL